MNVRPVPGMGNLVKIAQNKEVKIVSCCQNPEMAVRVNQSISDDGMYRLELLGQHSDQFKWRYKW